MLESYFDSCSFFVLQSIIPEPHGQTRGSQHVRVYRYPVSVWFDLAFIVPVQSSPQQIVTFLRISRRMKNVQRSETTENRRMFCEPFVKTSVVICDTEMALVADIAPLEFHLGVDYPRYHVSTL